MNSQEYTPPPYKLTRQDYEKMLDIEDPYTLLGISRDATDEEVTAAFGEVSFKFHPANAPIAHKDLAEDLKRKILDAASEISNNPDRRKQQTATMENRPQQLPKYVTAIVERLKDQGRTLNLPEFSEASLKNIFIIHTFYKNEGQTADTTIVPLTGRATDKIVLGAAYIASINQLEPGVAYINWSGSNIRCEFLPSGHISISPSDEKTSTEDDSYRSFQVGLQRFGFI